MEAAILVELNKPLVVADIEVPELMPGPHWAWMKRYGEDMPMWRLGQMSFLLRPHSLLRN